MSHGGRPTHDFWENGGYERRQEDKKIVEYCLICKRTLANAAKSRLQTYRNMCRNETDWSSTPQNSQSAGKSISTDTDDNGIVIETTELESIQSESITVDAITSLSDQRISKVIAIGVENAPEVPILLSGFDMPTVSHQEFSSAVSTTILPRSKRLKTMQSQKRRLDSYIDYISDQQKARINDTLVKFFYGCNMPLKMVESKLFWNFINAIRPAYTPLSAKAMSNEILHDLDAELGKYQSTFSLPKMY